MGLPGTYEVLYAEILNAGAARGQAVDVPDGEAILLES